MATEQDPLAEKIAFAKAIIALAAAEAADIDLTRGSFDAAKRYNTLHGHIDSMLTDLERYQVQAMEP